MSPQQSVADPCVYCDSPEPATRDHVPPKCLFPRPRPVDTVTVPACQRCNKSYEKDDVYFAVAMAMQGYADNPNGAAALVWTTTIRPLLRRSPRFRGMIAQNILDAPVRTPAGLLVPDRRAVRFAAPRIERVVRRIVRGLLWHHYRRKPAADSELVIFHQQPFPSEVADIINAHTNSSWIGDTIFRYRHGVALDAPDSSIWAMQFYAQAQFIVIVQGKSFVRAEQESASMLHSV